VLAEVGDDPNRFATAGGLCAFAGTAPITRASGRTKTVNARRVRNPASATPATGGRLPRSPKRPVPELTTTIGERPAMVTNASLRNLANKLLGRLWWCLVNNQSWDDITAWPVSTSDRTNAVA
jgi:hypothetical protein